VLLPTSKVGCSRKQYGPWPLVAAQIKAIRDKDWQYTPGGIFTVQTVEASCPTISRKEVGGAVLEQ